MKSICIKTAIFTCLLFSFGCKGKVYDLSEKKIDENTVSLIINANLPANARVKFNSAGGYDKSALQISELFLEKKVNIIVDKMCLSACAVIILPSATSIRFNNRPIIGFHWDNSMLRALLEEKSPKNLEFCDWQHEKKYRKLLNTAGLNENFWKEVKTRIHLESFDIYENEDQCPDISWQFSNELWLPTSLQLRELWGLKFEGKVCADNFSKCSKIVDHYLKRKKRIVIGDKIYISKGPTHKEISPFSD